VSPSRLVHDDWGPISTMVEFARVPSPSIECHRRSRGALHPEVAKRQGSVAGLACDALSPGGYPPTQAQRRPRPPLGLVRLLSPSIAASDLFLPGPTIASPRSWNGEADS